ncbi:diphthine--ammonia ligase [Synchiropus picturatus]
MKVVALISGGKDSCYNMMQCVAAGHHVVALANLRPAHTDELDSYMYQTVGHQAIQLYAEAMELPLYRRTIQGSSLDTTRDYTETEGDEVEDLYQLLLQVKDKEGVEGVSVGAILSDYQRVRVENVCQRLGLQPLAYLWRRDQETLLSEMISSGLHAILIKVAAFGLDPEKHLGKSLSEMQSHLLQLSQKFGVHICGEGGEYETLTLDCPLFKKKLVIDAAETVIHSADAFAPVGYLSFTQMHTESKDAAVASATPRGTCPCQRAIDDLTEEEEVEEYADRAEDDWQEFTSNSDLACQRGHDAALSCSSRSSAGFQWVSGLSDLQSEDVEGQTAAAFVKLQSVLDLRGLTMKDIVLVHLYVRRMDDFARLNSVYKKHFGSNPPARVCVQVPLPPGQLLRMDCLIQRWTEKDDSFHRREAMHVQSLSHWAPANIGPYSQAVRVDDSVFCAGQIALVPCSMQLVKAGTRTQARLCFSYVQKVLQAMMGELTLAHVVQAHCYATRLRDVSVIQAVWESMMKATEDEEDLESHVQVRPLLVVVVPALPRAAAVELHVTAIQDEPANRSSCHMTSKLKCGYIETDSVTAVGSSGATISLRLVAPSAGLDDREEVREAIVAAFETAIDKMEAGLTPLCARVFYKCGDSLAEEVAHALGESLSGSLRDSSPSVSLVPVLDLSDSQILHLSCWFSS